MVRCQYVKIPQVRETARLIGSRPFWLWGFEHGVNEHAVAVGNHTVFTRDALPKVGLLGMDLVRLALERAFSAAGAVEVITTLIEEHGQGGSGYFDKEWPYHNSFLIADASSAYLLETSGRHWAVREITGTGNASNHLSIGSDWDRISANALAHAVDCGWWNKADSRRFDFAAAYRDVNLAPPQISSGRHRAACALLETAKGKLSPRAMFAALRDHYGSPFPHADLAPSDERFFSICMHADPVGTTTASMVARLPADKHDLIRYWGSLGSPCVGIFLPYYLDGELPRALARGGEKYDADSPWWKFNRLLQLVERDFVHRAPFVRETWNNLEEEILRAAEEVEAKAIGLRRSGNFDAAHAILKLFMEKNVTTVLDTVDRLILTLERQ